MFEVGVVDRAVVRDLQWAVLRGTLPLPSNEPDLSAGAFCVGAFVDDGGQRVVVGAATFFPEACPDLDGGSGQWRLRGMATAPEHRGQGVGAAVLAHGIDVVVERGAVLVWCNARLGAVDFYRRQGFTTRGGEFLTADTGLPHVLAYRRVSPASGTTPLAAPASA